MLYAVVFPNRAVALTLFVQMLREVPVPGPYVDEKFGLLDFV